MKLIATDASELNLKKFKLLCHDETYLIWDGMCEKRMRVLKGGVDQQFIYTAYRLMSTVKFIKYYLGGEKLNHLLV